MAADPLIENDQLVTDLRDAIRDGGSGLAYVPRLLRRVLETGAWRERYDRSSRKPVPFTSFAEFVETAPTEGLGADVALIRRIVGEDTVTFDLLDRALQGPHGGDRRSVAFKDDNVSLESGGSSHGSSRSYALRRLRKERPDLHAEVLAGNLSAHAAMVQAGFRPKTFSVRADDAESVIRTLRKNTTPEFWAQLRQLIAAEGA